MNLDKLQIVFQDERGIIYNCGKVNYIVRKNGTISANHTHEASENLYLTKGDIELTIGNETRVVHAPIKISLEPNIYHKIVALTDIEIIEDKEQTIDKKNKI